MSINYQPHNLLHCVLHQEKKYPLNILYGKSDTLYDQIISDIDDSLCVINENNFDNYPINYGICFINDPLVFSQNLEKYSKIYSNKIIFFHNEPPPSIKKEDLFILSQRLSQYNCFSFTPNYQAWNNRSINYIPYGVPVDDNIDIDNKKYDILILDFKKQKHNKVLFDIIKNKYDNTQLIQTLPNNLKDGLALIAQYKICIDVDAYYNLLLASSVGCLGLTAKQSQDTPIIKSVQNTNEILDVVDEYITNYSINISHKTKIYISEKYNYGIFKDNIKNIVETFYKKACLA